MRYDLVNLNVKMNYAEAVKYASKNGYNLYILLKNQSSTVLKQGAGSEVWYFVPVGHTNEIKEMYDQVYQVTLFTKKSCIRGGYGKVMNNSACSSKTKKITAYREARFKVCH